MKDIMLKIIGKQYNTDEQTFRDLDIDVTSDPEYVTTNLYYN
jgi:uncharacterized protein (UPF0371 family)